MLCAQNVRLGALGRPVGYLLPRRLTCPLARRHTPISSIRQPQSGSRALGSSRSRSLSRRFLGPGRPPRPCDAGWFLVRVIRIPSQLSGRHHGGDQSPDRNRPLALRRPKVCDRTLLHCHGHLEGRDDHPPSDHATGVYDMRRSRPTFIIRAKAQRLKCTRHRYSRF